MRILGFELKRARLKGEQLNPHTLTDEEREMGLEVRRMTQMRRRMEHEIALTEQKVRLAELQAELAEYQGEDDGFNVDNLFQTFVQNSMAKLQGNLSSTPETPLSSPGSPATNLKHYTDAELVAFKEKIPKPLLKQIGRMREDEILEFASMRYPDLVNSIDEDTKKRALALLKQ